MSDSILLGSISLAVFPQSIPPPPSRLVTLLKMGTPSITKRGELVPNEELPLMTILADAPMALPPLVT